MSEDINPGTMSLGQRLKELASQIAKKTGSAEKGSKSTPGGFDAFDGAVDDEDCKFDLKDLFEIARVEGYDDGSYITASLKDIDRKLSNKDIEAASKVINEILGDVMPFDYQLFFELYKATEDTASRLFGKVCWVLLGPTGAGKSTSIHFLCGSQFVSSGEQGNVVVDNIHKSLADKDIKVGESVTESKTRYIAEVPLDLEQNGIECGPTEPSKILCVDSPGFEDTAGPEVNMANGIGTIRALKKAKAIKVIITFKEAHMDYRFKIIRSIANSMGKAVKNLDYQLNLPHGSPIAGFLTKSNHGVDAAKATFKKAYKEQKEKEADSNDNASFKAMIYKLGIKGPLNEIKIDLENSENNDVRRKKIIESLVKESGYIESPKRSFNEFISEGTLGKLKEQIEHDYSTIVNILNHDKYFENPSYIQYIIDILRSIDELKSIIKTAGGKYVESKLKECLDVFKTKWSHKIAKGQEVLTKMDLKDCSMRSMNKRLTEFAKIENMMKANMKVIHKSKYHKELKDINCLNEEFHRCFDDLYEDISIYLNQMVNKLKSDEDVSDTDVEKDDEKYQQYDDGDDEEVEEVVDTNYRNDDDYDKKILLYIQKCSVLKQHQKDRYIEKKWRKLDKLITKIMTELKGKCNNLISKKTALNVSNIQSFMHIYRCLYKLEQIVMAKDANLNNAMPMERDISDYHPGGEEYDEYDESKGDDESSAVYKIIKKSIDTLKGNVEKTIKSICKSYSLHIMPVTLANDGNNIRHYVDIDEILTSKAIKTEDQIRKREDRLISFCKWITQFNEALADTNLSIILTKFSEWLNIIKNNFIEWLSNACNEELKTCNKLLIEKQAEGWKSVEKLVNECESLRKVEDISNNTSQEFFKTLSEFEFSKTNLAKQAAELIDELDADSSNINYDKILRIANQLYSAGCSKESTEMKQIYQKLKFHLKELKLKTDTFSLSVEAADDLIIVQNTMNELDTIQRFADFMPDIKEDANECYKTLNDQVLDVLREINRKYDLEKCSTQNSRDLKQKLDEYLDIKSKIDEKLLNEVIMQCSLRSLTELINKNKKKMNELKSRNEAIQQMIQQKGGAIIKEKEKYGKMHKKGKNILMMMEMEDVLNFLKPHGFNNLKQVKAKIDELTEQSQSICAEEQEEAKHNKAEIDRLNNINHEIEKCVEIENDLKALNVTTNTIVEYRRNNHSLKTQVSELEELLQGNQMYLFTQKLSLNDTYRALRFLRKCKGIRWNLKNKIDEEKGQEKSVSVISNRYVSQINENVSKYLRAYGENLETNLNNLLRELSITDIEKCDLNDMKFRNSVSNAISKLNDCLREFRDVSSFDHQIKLQIEEDIIYNEDSNKPKQKQLKLVSSLFSNFDIQRNVDEYIYNIISNHKQDILLNFAQWKDERPATLPILHFICLSMSSLDRYISSSKQQDQEQTYYRIASKIDTKLNEFGDDNTQKIVPLSEAKNWTELGRILQDLQDTAGVSKTGVAQKSYRNAVMKLYCLLNKLINETKNKLLVDINKNNDVDEAKIMALNDALKDVTSLVETILPHLKDKYEKDKIKKEAEGLFSLLTNRLRQLMDAALQSVKRRDFKMCERRLDNISKLMEFNTQTFISINDGNADDDEEAKEKQENGINIVDEYNNLRDNIKAELDEIRSQVEKANKSLSDTNVFNPYSRLRLVQLHAALSTSQNELFTDLWIGIYDDILAAIQNILNKIKERSNQLQMQNEYQTTNKGDGDNKMMSYQEQNQYLRKIRLSLSSFPEAMKETIQALLTETEKLASGNVQYIEEGYDRSLESNSFDAVARSLNAFKHSNPSLYNKSQRSMITKMNAIYDKFRGNMKSNQGFLENLNELDLYKTIGLTFTNIKYGDDDDSNGNINNIRIDPIQNLLAQIYKEIKKLFFNQCEEVKHSLVGYKKYTLLKSGFFTIIQVVERKNKFPVHIAQYIATESRKLVKPMEKLINKLKMLKIQGLDRENCDIGILLTVLDDLKELTENDLHSNMRKFLPMIDEKIANQMDKAIEQIEYEDTVRQTKDMLDECKQSVSTQGLSKKMVQQDQVKRLKFLKKSAMQITALVKAGSASLCSNHLAIDTKEFKKKFIEPCTKKMRTDIQKMEKETNDAFKKNTLNTKELDRANANFEALYAMKDVFEKEIEDNELLEEIKVDAVIESCTDTATTKVNNLVQQIRNGNKNDVDGYMNQCAKNLINLEYLSKHINFKTSINENASDHVVDNEENEISRDIQSAIRESMDSLTKDTKTKGKINTLYNHIVSVDPNYGSVFTQQQPAFKSSLAKAMNEKFRALDIDALIQNLKESEKQILSKHKRLTGIDYDKIRETFEEIKTKYDQLVMKHLRKATSFEILKSENIPELASDVKGIAEKAVRSKQAWYNNVMDSGKALITSVFSWSSGSKSKNDPRKCYWTDELITAASVIMPYILAIWTLSTASCYYESSDKAVLMKARNAQILAVCCLLCLDIEVKNEILNNLVEVGTGEGKSVIMAITAITLAMLDFDVYCACYSELLSKRDEEAFNDLFMMLGVQNHIHYQTFNNIFEQVINDGGDIRETTKKIVLAQNVGNSDDSKIDTEEEKKRLLQKRRKILFIDEVDKFFSTDFFGKQYTPSCVIPKAEMKTLILYVWNQYLSNNSEGMTITMQMIEASDEYQALLNAFNNEWHALLKESMKDIIDGIRTFKEDSYKIVNGRDIAYKFSDTYSTKVFYGYRTIFTYLYELNKGEITDEPYVHQKLTWFLKCGSFSYSEIPNDFYAIIGVTGTLNSLSPKEHDVMQTSYGIRKYVIMPSLFDKSGKLDYAKNKDIYALKRDHFHNQLQSTIELRRTNDIESIKRPIIVFFKNEDKLNDFYNLEVCEEWRINDVIQMLTPDLSEQEKRNRILNATKPNTITFATEEYGRGIDFKVFDKKLALKGMHVELTYWPETLAEEIQIKGRTARQGQKGSFHIILNEDAVSDQCHVSNEEIQQHRDDGDLYDWLSAIRSKVFAKQYDEAFDYVKQLKPIHKESEQLAAALRTNNVKVATEKLLGFNKGANVQSDAKLSILIDCTGSMSSCLNRCKIVIQKTIPKLVEFLTSNGINAESFEIQVVGYRNYNAPSDEILRFCTFTSNENFLSNFIHSLTPDYGWGAEAVEVAFKQLNRQKKKPNIVMLMADAPAHEKADIQRKRGRRGDAYWNKEGDGLFTDLDWKEELNKFMSENGDSKVFCFYVTNWAQANFDEIAKIGNGKSMHLNVDNEKQSIGVLQGALSETILLAINNGDMAYVNKFRAQHKNIPTFL